MSGFDQAQMFTTGNNSSGYALTSVDVQFAQVSNSALSTKFTATIRNASGPSPGTVVGTLTNPATIPTSNTDQTVNFAASDGGIYLAANTRYFFVIDVTATTTPINVDTIRNTASNSEDSGAAPGWSIANGSVFRSWFDGTTTWTSFGEKKKIRINGDIRGPLPVCETASGGAYSVPADWQLTPAGLNPGDRFRLMFISSTQRNATSANIGDYNTHVQTAAKNGHSAMTDGCGNQFKVVGSTTAVNARDNAGLTGTGVPIYWLGGVKSADDYADFLDGSISGRSKHEDGSDNTVTTGFATGSNADGTAFSGEELGTTGTIVRRGNVGIGLQDIHSLLKTENHHFLALSPVFEVHVDIKFKETEVSLSENAGDGGLVIVLGEARSVATTVNIVLTGDTATAGADFEYEPNQYRVTIPAFATEARVNIALIDDSAFEPDEVFTASIQVLGGLSLSVGADATITILDDDWLIQDPPTLRVTEGQGAGYTLRLARAPTSDVTVALVATTVDGTTPVTLSRSSLTITNSNWNDPAQHRVTVTAPADANNMDELVVIIHSMTSSDTDFNAKTDDYLVRVGDRQGGKPLITLSHHDESPRSVKGSPRSIEEGQYPAQSDDE